MPEIIGRGVAIVLTQRQESNNRNYEFVEKPETSFCALQIIAHRLWL
jgi:hypothetical protein